MSDADRPTVDDPASDPNLEALAQAIEEMRADLQTVTGRDVPLLKGTVRQLLATDIESMHELPPAGREFAERLDELADQVAALEERVEAFEAIESEQTTKEQKYAGVLAYAENKASGRQSEVAVSAQEIKGCVGVSRRYAYDLIEAMAEEVAGVEVREGKRVETRSGTKRKKKALLVDCEAVHERTGRVNSFTTDSGATGGEQ